LSSFNLFKCELNSETVKTVIKSDSLLNLSILNLHSQVKKPLSWNLFHLNLHSQIMLRVLLILLAFAGIQARYITPTGVDLQPIFEFLDDDGDEEINLTELMALSAIGDANGDGEVTQSEFDDAWSEVAVTLGFPMENRGKYFQISDGADGSDDNGILTASENKALFYDFDKNISGKIDIDEFYQAVNQLMG